jgi:hypothetical protein
MNEDDLQKQTSEFLRIRSEANIYIEMRRIADEELWKKAKSIDRLIDEYEKKRNKPNISPQRLTENLNKQLTLCAKSRAYYEVIKLINEKLREKNPLEDLKAFGQKYNIGGNNDTPQ